MTVLVYRPFDVPLISLRGMIARFSVYAVAGLSGSLLFVAATGVYSLVITSRPALKVAVSTAPPNLTEIVFPPDGLDDPAPPVDVYDPIETVALLALSKLQMLLSSQAHPALAASRLSRIEEYRAAIRASEKVTHETSPPVGDAVAEQRDAAGRHALTTNPPVTYPAAKQPRRPVQQARHVKPAIKPRSHRVVESRASHISRARADSLLAPMPNRSYPIAPYYQVPPNYRLSPRGAAAASAQFDGVRPGIRQRIGPSSGYYIQRNGIEPPRPENYAGQPVSRAHPPPVRDGYRYDKEID